MRRFSADHLRGLRRAVSLAFLLERLGVEVLWRGGRRVFRCPLCRAPRAALHPRLNLARCFRCGRSFNAIDLAIAHRRCSFPDAVRYLERIAALARSPTRELGSCGTLPFLVSREKRGSNRRG